VQKTNFTRELVPKYTFPYRKREKVRWKERKKGKYVKEGRKEIRLEM
jgi:hypothetical protein